MRPIVPVLSHCLRFVLLAMLGLGSCKRIEKGTPAAVTETIERMCAQYCPDPRLGVFDIDVLTRGANLKLLGEMNDPNLKVSLVEAVKKAVPDFKVEEEIRVLPDPRLGEERFGVVRVSVANIRERPNHKSALVNQVLAGSVVAILKAKDGWYYVQSEDDYLGWVTGGSLQRCSTSAVDEWLAADLVAFNKLHGVIRAEASETSLPISEMVLGNLIRRLQTIRVGSPRAGQMWLKVALPDGREGFLPQTDVAAPTEVFPRTPTSPQRVVTTAQRFLGVPFLWGGNSVHGFNAAGFVQTVLRLNGLRLLRDADQQAREGRPIEVSSDFSELHPADLLFFGKTIKQIDHVGISLGGARFIHVADFVKISSLDPNDPNYERELHDGYQFARRYLEEVMPVPGDGK
ncbi:MAG: NlpC/P60 family protein [candidate division KSB1 bacterium]|nr:NlpC/P60 family protein [candidate division KSB1 bacterium]MDZ7303821.1 NlpC/P60 family protein [candidate division KSB1 bacterium]MDZ7314168.1 NlpC/P60 family protein [candidate division KSB1 bacterium]